MSKMTKYALSSALLLVSGASLAALPPAPSAGYVAETFAFDCAARCDRTPSLEDQLFVQVIRDADLVPDDANIYFKFWNLTGEKSSVQQISIEGWSDFTLLGGSGTRFEIANRRHPRNLAGVRFDEDITFRARARGRWPRSAAGIDSETDTFELYTTGVSFEELIAAIGSGSLRFGLRVAGFEDGGRATYINAAAPVPEPGTYALMLGGLGIVAAFARRQRGPSVQR
jgi:hypothetical protein